MQPSTDNFLLYFDISATETPDYEQFCPTSIAFAQGQTIDTWFDLCSEYANNVKVGMDLTWSIMAKFDTSDAVAQFILGKEYAVGTSATCPVRLVNLLKGASGKQIDFTATISDIAYTAETPTVLEIRFDLRIYSGSTFAETDYVAPSV